MRFFVALALTFGCYSSAADSPSIYESLDGISIGRVFLTPEARRALDERRGTVAAASPRSADRATGGVPNNSNGFGYIILQDGTSSSWINGDFRAVENPRLQDPSAKSKGLTIRANDEAARETVTADAPVDDTDVVPGRPSMTGNDPENVDGQDP